MHARGERQPDSSGYRTNSGSSSFCLICTNATELFIFRARYSVRFATDVVCHATEPECEYVQCLWHRKCVLVWETKTGANIDSIIAVDFGTPDIYRN